MFKKFLSVLLILSIVTPALYLPQQAKKAEAFLGFGDIVVDIKELVERIADGFAMAIAQQMVDHMVQSTVKWAQSGFEGNPAYVTDPSTYFLSIADQTAGQFIKGGDGDLGMLCSPFQANIRLSLTQQYYESQPFQCTLSGVVGNIDDFLDDFNKGGWEAWFSMTQNPTNNPYGAYLSAKIELDKRIANAVGLKKQELDWNQGFLNWSGCAVQNEVEEFIDERNPETGEFEHLPNPNHVPGKAPGECIERGPTQTPGSTIKTQLDKVLPSGLDKLITAQHLDQLVSSFASGLLTRYVFGSKGLFASNSTTGSGGSGGSADSGSKRAGMIDLDGDSIPDGQDSDYDGKLESSTDTCLHGGSAPTCTKSLGLTSSPYFTPICESINKGVATLREYGKFLDSHAEQMSGGTNLVGKIWGAQFGPQAFIGGLIGWGGGAGVDNFKNKADADIWSTRTSEATSAVDEILGRIQSRNSSYFDDVEIVTNRFSNYMGKVLESLIKDKDLDLARRGNGGGGLENLMRNTAYNLRYFQEVKDRLGKCEKPSVSTIPSVPLPPEVPGVGGEETGGGQCNYATSAGNDAGAPSTIDESSIIWDENQGAGGWAVMGNLSSVTTGADSITLNYDKANSWPQIGFDFLGCPNGATSGGNCAPVVGNAWVIAWRNGAWHASTFEWLRPGQTQKGTENLIGADGTLKGALGNFSPRTGETYGFVVTTPARNGVTGSVNERTNIVTQTWEGPVCSGTNSQ